MKSIIGIFISLFLVACGKSDKPADCHSEMQTTFANIRAQQDEWYLSRGAPPPPEHHKAQLHLGSKKRAVVLVHGFISSPEAMSEIAQPLIQDGYTVVMPLLTGFASEPQAANASTESDWQNAVVTASALAKLCHEEVVVVAHSLGGGLTTKAMHEGKIDPAKVVLRSPLFKAGAWPATIEKAIPDRIQTIDLVGLQKWFGFVDFSELLPIYKAHPTDREPYIPMIAAERVLKLHEEFELARSAPPLSPPTIMIVSSDDRVVDPIYAVEYGKKSFSNFKYHSYEESLDVGHSLQRRAENSKFDQLLRVIHTFVTE